MSWNMLEYFVYKANEVWWWMMFLGFSGPCHFLSHIFNRWKYINKENTVNFLLLKEKIPTTITIFFRVLCIFIHAWYNQFYKSLYTVNFLSYAPILISREGKKRWKVFGKLTPPPLPPLHTSPSTHPPSYLASKCIQFYAVKCM